MSTGDTFEEIPEHWPRRIFCGVHILWELSIITFMCFTGVLGRVTYHGDIQVPRAETKPAAV